MNKRNLTIGGLLLLPALAAAGWLSARPADPMLRADQLVKTGDLRGAQVELRNALRAQPDSAETHLRMAKLQMKLADPVAAEREFRAAQQLGDNRAKLAALLAEAMLAQGENREVLAMLPAGGATPDVAARNLLMRSIAQFALNDLDGAEATLALARQAAPNHAEVPLIAARLAAARGDLALTAAKVDETLRLDPAQIDALLMKEQLLTMQGDRQAALAMASRAVASAPWSAMARMRRAKQLVFAGKDAAAQADVTAVLETQPRFIEAVYLNGVLMARRGRFADASVEMSKLGAAVQRMPQALYYQAMLAGNLGQKETALDFARRYNTAVPADADGVRLLARTELAAGLPDRALPILERAVAAGQTDAETLDLLGGAYGMLGKLPLALQSFQQASAQAPGDAGLLEHLGTAQMQLGDAGAATRTFERSIALSPGQPSAGEALVMAALGTGDTAKAEAALTQLRAKEGSSEAVLLLAARIRVAQQDLDGARAALADARRRFPSSIPARLGLAQIMVQQGQRGEGSAAMAAILATNPADGATLGAYVRMLVSENQLKPALQALEAAHRAEPQQVQATVMLADLLTLTGDARRAATLLRGLRTASAPPVMAALARAQSASGSVDDAKASYAAVMAAAPDDLVNRSAQVALLVGAKDTDGAKAALRDALAAAPGNLRVMQALAALEYRTAGPDAALRLAGRLRKDPANMPAAAVLEGDVMMASGRFQDAAAAFQGEYRAAPAETLSARLVRADLAAGQDDAATRATIEWLQRQPDSVAAAQTLAQLDIKAHRYGDAVQHLGMVLSKQPENALALNNLAWTYHLMGDKRAQEVARRAYLNTPNAEVADTFGWILLADGDAQAALPLLRRSSAARPADPSVQYHLAVALRDDGQPGAAAAVLKPIMANGQPFDERPDASRLLQQLEPQRPAAP